MFNFVTHILFCSAHNFWLIRVCLSIGKYSALIKMNFCKVPFPILVSTASQCVSLLLKNLSILRLGSLYLTHCNSSIYSPLHSICRWVILIYYHNIISERHSWLYKVTSVFLLYLKQLVFHSLYMSHFSFCRKLRQGSASALESWKFFQLKLISIYNEMTNVSIHVFFKHIVCHF